MSSEAPPECPPGQHQLYGDGFSSAGRDKDGNALIKEVKRCRKCEHVEYGPVRKAS